MLEKAISNKNFIGKALILLFLAIAAPVSVQAEEKKEAAKIEFLSEKLIVLTKNGDKQFKTEIAQTTEQLEQGLMFREKMSDDAAMLFVFNGPNKIAMWMKNTLIPLDMLFIDSKGKIVYIAYDNKPNSLTPVGPGNVPVKAVLEIKSGLAKANNINIGDRIISKVFEK